MYRLLGIKNCDLLNHMEYDCEHRPLEMIMICLSELNWVMLDVLELHACNCS